MKIILLSGKPNTGKTTTLNLLYDKITQNGTKNIIAKKEEFKYPAIKDFECIVSYNSKKTAIFSMGDVYGTFIEVIIKYANCDILVLAYSERFVKKLDEVIKKYDYHCVIRKTSSKKDEDVCEEIIAELNKQH